MVLVDKNDDIATNQRLMLYDTKNRSESCYTEDNILNSLLNKSMDYSKAPKVLSTKNFAIDS